MACAVSKGTRWVSGECLAPALRPARFVFREPTGKVLFHVEQVSPVGFWHHTKLRTALALELAWSGAAGGRHVRLTRAPGWWKPRWELREVLGSELFSFIPGSFWGTSWTVTNARTGAVAVARVRNPFILGRQKAEIEGLGGHAVARFEWSEYSWRLGCQRYVRIELEDEAWELAAMALAVIRWAALQQR